MARFETHLRIAAAAHLILTTVAVAGTILGAPTTVLVASSFGLPITLIGGVLPDCDHPNSRPYRVLRVWAPRIGAAYVTVFLGSYRSALVELYKTFALPGDPMFWSGAAYMTAIIGTYIFLYRAIPVLRPTHRGVFHHPALGLGLGAFVTALTAALLLSIGVERGLLESLVIGSCFVAGFVSHIVKDRFPQAGTDLLE